MAVGCKKEHRKQMFFDFYARDQYVIPEKATCAARAHCRVRSMRVLRVKKQLFFVRNIAFPLHLTAVSFSCLSGAAWRRTLWLENGFDYATSLF
jgi:hypothetical protein